MPKSFYDLPALPESADAFALVSIDTFIALSKVRPPLQQNDGFGPITIYRFKRQVDPFSQETDKRASEEETTSKVIHSANKGEGSPETAADGRDKPLVETVTIRWSRTLSEHQVLLFNVKSIGEWEPWYFVTF